jgi:hypothetical protein
MNVSAFRSDGARRYVAQAADIHGLALESLMPSIQLLLPDCESKTGHKVTFNSGNSSTFAEAA